MESWEIKKKEINSIVSLLLLLVFGVRYALLKMFKMKQSAFSFLNRSRRFAYTRHKFLIFPPFHIIPKYQNFSLLFTPLKAMSEDENSGEDKENEIESDDEDAKPPLDVSAPVFLKYF